MKLIWTYSSKLHRNNQITKDQILRLYKESIKRGGSYYATSVYTTQEDKGYFEELVDEVVIIPEGLDYFLDDIKLYALSNEDINFCLIDGDLMLHEPLKFSDNPVDIEFFTDNKADKHFFDYRVMANITGTDRGYFNLGLVAVHDRYWIKGLLDHVEKFKTLYKKEYDIPVGMEVQYLVKDYIRDNNIPFGLMTETSYIHLGGPGPEYKLNFLKSLEPKSFI